MTRRATFGAGCFWGVEAAFRQLDGVTRTRVGYSGGHTENPTYEDVCSGTTGHAEAVEVNYDPERVSYEQLLDTFWHEHDPTRGNHKRGPGDQYRSVVFAHSDEQAEIARSVIERTQPRFRKPIVTEIEPAKPFWRAEEYHQCYLEKRGSHSGLMGMLLGR